MTANPFPADALEPNRGGILTETQRQNLRALAADQHRNARTIAAFLAAGAMIVWFLARPDTPLVERGGIAGGALLIAACLVVRSVTGSDALSRDLEDAQVTSAEGAIGKRRVSNGRARSQYYLAAGDRSFRIGRDTYDWLPLAGRVRVFFLPRSRKVVNIEVLPNPVVPLESVREKALELLGGVLSRGRAGNEARAELAGVADAFKAAFEQAPQPPPADARDQAPLGQAILGTWSNGIVRATFSADGTFVARMFTGERRAHWSVDSAGRLRADIGGGEQSIEAWIAGDKLTIVLDGRGMTLLREPR
jgi:hypothetical protein